MQVLDAEVRRQLEELLKQSATEDFDDGSMPQDVEFVSFRDASLQGLGAVGDMSLDFSAELDALLQQTSTVGEELSEMSAIDVSFFYLIAVSPLCTITDTPLSLPNRISEFNQTYTYPVRSIAIEFSLIQRPSRPSLKRCVC